MLFSMLYSIRFIAKGLVSVETNSNPEFSKYEKELISLWILPLGITSIQPRLQKIFKDKN